MAVTAIEDQLAGDAMDRFHQRNSAEGLFLRYCRGRLNQIRVRVAVGIAGSATFGFLHEPLLGLYAVMLLLIGESLEVIVLRRIVARIDLPDVDLLRARRLARLVGIVHALATIAAVAVVWVLGDDGESEFLAAVFLAGAAMDAGVSIRAERTIALAKLTIYCVGFAALQVQTFTLYPIADWLSGSHGYDLVASLTLAFVTVNYIRFTVRTHDLRLADQWHILEENGRLALARQALDEKNAEAWRLALVARHANDGVIIYTETGMVDWVNETFCRITGFSASEIVGRRIEDVIPDDQIDPEGTKALIAARRDMREYRGELKTHTKSGDPLWIEASLTPIPASPGTPAIMIAVERDITEAKAHQAELAEARARAEEAAQTKTRFLATMSHEIRTPMNGVIGTAELLADTSLDSDQELYVDTIVQSGKALLAIINDILDLSRLQAGAVVFARERVDLSACVTGAVELLRPAARAKGIGLNLRLPVAGGPMVMADDGRLRQIALNLVGNAIKFTEAGSVTISLLSRRIGRGTASREEIRLSVADTGIGIPADRIDAIFDSFTQAGEGIGRKFGGTGLGLTISRRLAQEMGGDLEVTSQDGAGSVFSLRTTLDAAAAETAAPAALTPVLAQKAAVAQTGSDGPMPVILLAEDNRTNVLIVERMLRPEGFEVVVAVDGSAAVAAFLEATPDIVLMDLSMPGMNGFEALRAIREIERRRAGPRCPIIALTANSFEEDRRACVAAGFDGFATKPVQKATLIGEILRAAAAVAAEQGTAPAASMIGDVVTGRRQTSAVRAPKPRKPPIRL